MENKSFYIDLYIRHKKALKVYKMEDKMMPLQFANVGEENMIKKVGGAPEVRKFLENLGFVAGATVTVVSEISGNIIVNIKESRVAISKEMACRIMV